MVIRDHYVCGKCNRSKLATETATKLAFSDDRGHTAAMTGRPRSEKRNARRPRRWSQMKCLWCDRPDHFSRDYSRPNREGAEHSWRWSEEKSTGHKSSNRNERFGSREMIITKREERTSGTVRENVSRNNQEFQQKIIVDSGGSEQVVSDKLYLTDVKEIHPVTVELANGTSVSATKRGIAELEISGRSTVPCRAYSIPGIKLNLLSCSRMEYHSMSTTFGLCKCRIVDRDGNILVLGTLYKRKRDGLFDGRPVALINNRKATIAMRTPDREQCCSAESVKKGSMALWPCRL